MKSLILSTVLAAAVSVAAAEEKKKVLRPTTGTRIVKRSDPKPVTLNQSTATSTQVFTRDGQTDGTVTVTINKDGKTEVKTWKIGGGAGGGDLGSVQKVYSHPVSFRSAGKMEKVTWLGVAVTEVSEDLASQLPLPDGVGLRVRQVIDDSPASKAGLRADDLIAQLDQQMIFNVQQFQALTRTYEAGEEVEITYYRKGRKSTATAKLAKKEMLVNQAASSFIDWRRHPDANKAWKSVLEHRAKAAAQQKQAEDAAKRAQEAMKMQSWIRSAPANKRAVIVRPDGKTTVVRSMDQMRSEIRKNVLEALKKADVSEKVLKDTMKAFDKGFEGHPEN